MNNNVLTQDRVDILKAFAMISVIFIHSISQSLKYTTPLSTHWFNLITIDQLARFCVPLFIALSGYGLAAKYLNQKIDLINFYTYRILKIFPQYIFWSIVIYFTLFYLHPLTGEVIRLNIIQSLIFGSADYHLYFIPLIFQFYLLFPLILYLSKNNILATLGFSLLLQSVIFIFIGEKTEINSYNEKWNDQRQYIFFGSWIFYFVLGISLNYINKINKLKYYSVLFLSLLVTSLGFFWTITNTKSLAFSGVDIQAVTRFTKLPVLIYSTGFIVFFSLIPNFTKSFVLLRKILLQIGKNSYTTYLLHTLVLRILLIMYPSLTIINIFFFGGLVTLVSVIISEGFNNLLKYKFLTPNN